MTLAAILSDLLPYALGVMGALVAAFMAWASGRQAGRAAEQLARRQQEDRDREKGDAAARNADRDPDPAGRLRRDWTR